VKGARRPTRELVSRLPVRDPDAVADIGLACHAERTAANVPVAGRIGYDGPKTAGCDMQEYDQIADWYVSTRDAKTGIPALRRFTRNLPASGKILDLGCGDGIPISQFLIREGFDVVAVDSSPEMIARYRRNFPDVPARGERAEQCTFPDGSFVAVVAWGVLFHLSEAEQRTVITKVAGWLKPGGRFLFTSGKARGTREGTMYGVTFRYTSLGVNEYRSLMQRTGLELEDNYHDAWENFVYIARKDR